MLILLNGQKHKVKDGTTIKELVGDRTHVAVALNETVIRRDQWEQILHENDQVELVTPFQGG